MSVERPRSTQFARIPQLCNLWAILSVSGHRKTANGSAGSRPEGDGRLWPGLFPAGLRLSGPCFRLSNNPAAGFPSGGVRILQASKDTAPYRQEQRKSLERNLTDASTTVLFQRSTVPLKERRNLIRKLRRRGYCQPRRDTTMPSSRWSPGAAWGRSTSIWRRRTGSAPGAGRGSWSVKSGLFCGRVKV